MHKTEVSTPHDSPTADAQSMISSAIGTAKTAVHQLSKAQILAFIQAQPDIREEVVIDRLLSAREIGASSGIVLFEATYDTGDGPVTQDLVLRHAPGSETRLFFEYDLARQFRVQRALQGSGAKVPLPLWLDPDGRWLGVPGFVMVAVKGVAPHPSAFIKGPLAEAAPADRERMLDQVMQAMVRIHRTDVAASGLGDFVMNAPGDTPMARCINWYWQTWDWIGIPQYQRLVPVHQWLLANAPQREPELMHGDCTLHNYLFDGSTLTAVLDWEMSSLGNVEADLALQCVANGLFAAPPESGLTRPPSEDEWLARYRAAGGREVRDFAYFKKFAAYMIVIAVSALQRNLPPADRTAQGAMLLPCWALLED